MVGGGEGGTNFATLRSLAITLKLCNITNFTKMLFSLVPADFPLLVPV